MAPANRTLFASLGWTQLFRGIEQERGTHGHAIDRHLFLHRKLLATYKDKTPKKKWSHKDLAERAISLEKSLSERIKGNLLDNPAKDGNSARPYNINDLFMLGARAVLKPEFLKKIEFDTHDVGAEKDDGADRDQEDESEEEGDTQAAETGKISSEREMEVSDPNVEVKAQEPVMLSNGEDELSTSSTPESTPIAASPSAANSSPQRPSQKPGAQRNGSRMVALKVPEQPFRGNHSKSKRKAEDVGQPELPKDKPSGEKRRKVIGTDQDSEPETRSSDTGHKQVKQRGSEVALTVAPAIPPAQQPARSESMLPHCSQNWVSEHMEKLKSALLATQHSYFTKHQIVDLAPSRFLTTPSLELRGLYQRLMGDGRWSHRLHEQ